MLGLTSARKKLQPFSKISLRMVESHKNIFAGIYIGLDHSRKLFLLYFKQTIRKPYPFKLFSNKGF